MFLKDLDLEQSFEQAKIRKKFSENFCSLSSVDSDFSQYFLKVLAYNRISGCCLWLCSISLSLYDQNKEVSRNKGYIDRLWHYLMVFAIT